MRWFGKGLLILVPEADSFKSLRDDIESYGALNRDWSWSWQEYRPSPSSLGILNVQFRRAGDAMLFRLGRLEESRVYEGNLRG